MSDIVKIISQDIDWRMSELASLKSIPLRYHLLGHHQKMLLKYSIPSIYALWEGFVRNSFSNYRAEINSLKLTFDEFHINLIVHAITSIDKLKLENPRSSFEKKKEFTQVYLKTISESFTIPDVVPTKSNVNFEVINEILSIFNLELLPSAFKKPLEKLLNFRNSIAHGEVLIPIRIEDVEKFTELLNDLMVEILLRIDNGLKLKTYKKAIFES